MRGGTIAIALLSVGLAVLYAGGRVGQAATLSVCQEGCPYSTIQGAINDAQNGDTISISPGTYVEHLVFTSKSHPPVTATTLSMVGAGAGQTIIQGGGIGPFGSEVVFIDTGYDVSIEGVTVTGGAGGFTGGGIVASGNLTLINSAVTGNSARYGGGIYVFGSSSTTLVNSQVTGNSAQATGGGIWNTGTLTLVAGSVTGNTAGTGGGGIESAGGFVRNHGATIANNTPDDCAGAAC